MTLEAHVKHYRWCGIMVTKSIHILDQCTFAKYNSWSHPYPYLFSLGRTLLSMHFKKYHSSLSQLATLGVNSTGVQLSLFTGFDAFKLVLLQDHSAGQLCLW